MRRSRTSRVARYLTGKAFAAGASKVFTFVLGMAAAALGL
jgi:type IV secretory pathway TrbD component